MFCIEAVIEETKDKITNLLAKVHMWVLKIVLTAANDAKIESRVPVPVMGASKDSDYNLITRRNCQRSTYIFLFINNKITCNGRHQDLEEWAKTGSPDTVILYLYWGSGQKPDKLWTKKRPLPQQAPPLTCRLICVISQFFIFSVLRNRVL